MTTRYIRSKAVMAKIETVYATDSVPTGAANAVLCKSDVRFQPMVSERVPREVIQAYMGHQQDLPVGTHCTIEIDVEAAGAGGAVDLPPAWGPLMRMCGWQQTITAIVSVAYNPISSGFDSGSIYFNQDGVLHKMLGCRGSLSVKTPPKQIPYFTFKLMGLYGGVIDAALTAQTISGFKVPKPVNKANTPTFSLHGYSGVVYDMSFDMANQMVYRNLIGKEDVVITDRAPTGSVEIEAPLIAEKDFFTISNNVTLGTLQLIHGIGAGNVVQFDFAAAQVQDVTQTNRDGVVAYQMPLRITPTSAGNNEVTITTK